MHETAQHSAVSDALTAFACGPLDASAAAATRAARARLDDVRACADASHAAASPVAAVLQPLRGSGNDLRVRAWTLGAVLAAGRRYRQNDDRDAAPDIPVLAAAVTVGDALGASAAAIGEAAAVGIEAGARVLAAVDSDEFRARWNVASAIGVLGATLALARLYQLDTTRARHALGIAATQAAGLARNAGEAVGALETGKAAADAIEAALIAKHGFTSAPASIDGRRGFAALMAYRFDAGCIVDALGSHWISAR